MNGAACLRAPPSARMGKGGVGDHIPLSHAYGAACPRAPLLREWSQGRRALAFPAWTGWRGQWEGRRLGGVKREGQERGARWRGGVGRQEGRGGGRCGVPPGVACHPPFHMAKWEGAGGGVPSCVPLLREWGGEGLGRGGSGADRGEGAPGDGGDKENRRRRDRTPHANGYMGEGEGMGGRALVRRLSARTRWCGQGRSVLEGKRRGLTYVCPLSALEWGGGQCGGRGRRGRGRLTLVHPCLRTKGAARDAGDGEGRRPVLLRPLFDANGKGGGDGRATGMGGREEREGMHSILYESGGMQSGPFPVSFPLSPPLLPPPPTPFGLKRGCKRAGRRLFPLHHAQRGAHEDRGTQCPPPLGLLRAATFARKGGARGHATAAPLSISSTHSRTRCPWPLPFPLGRATLYAREGGWHATPGGTPHRPPPLPSCLRRPIRTEGARDAGHPPFLSHSRGRGTHDGTPPHLSTSPPAPALPSSRHPDASLPIGRATPSVRGTRVHAAPGSTRAEGVHACRAVCVGKGDVIPDPTLPHSRGRGCTQARCSVHASRGSRGRVVSGSRTSAVFVRLRSPCPHPIFARRSTT
ncbi:hypothetical protein EDB86DRAFT_2827154 [Lactarius hatsudake]|nr:hypothetical protein EDB86DRAFT_2827154 [Lactarius hatsudake]